MDGKYISLREAAQLMNPKNDFKCASCNWQSGCSTKRCYCKRNNTKCLSQWSWWQELLKPAEFEQDCENDLKQEQNYEEEISQKQNYCKPGSQVQENEDKSTTAFGMEDNFVSIQNKNQDHTNTSVHKDDIMMMMMMESGKDKLSERQTQQLIFSCGVLTCILIKRTDLHSYTINSSLTNIFVLHRYY